MHYIIDANNLAGKLKMLGDENFDKKLVNMIRQYNREKRRKITLVFDGSDPFGDKQEVGDNIIVIYSPKDKYYKNADDKIIELVQKETTSDVGYPTSDVVSLVTDDRELIKRVEKLLEASGKNVTIQSTTLFAEKLKPSVYENDNDGKENRGLSERQVNKINKEMLTHWQ